MRRFYQTYQIQQTLSAKLSWSHYCELLIISDPDRRSFYEKECERSGWSVREMKRQIATSLFERLLLSDGKANKEKVYELATKGQELAVPEDIVKDPYVFEFLGIPENKPVLESDLEKALVRQIEDFMLELGRGFMFVGTQHRGTLNNTHASEVNEQGDNPPIGIILCTDKDNVSAEYALGGLSNNIFASTYTYVIPEKEKLIAQVEAVLEKWEDKEE